MLDISRVKADYKKFNSEEEKLKYFDGIVAQMDKDDENNERRHQNHRANFDMTVLDRGTDEDNQYIPSEFTKLYFSQPLLDEIFSAKFVDLHQLPRFGVISCAIAELTDNRKEVLFLKVVQKFTETEIAEYKGVSQSSVSQLYKKAIAHIRLRISEYINYKLYLGCMLSKHEINFYIKFMWPLEKAG